MPVFVLEFLPRHEHPAEGQHTGLPVLQAASAPQFLVPGIIQVSGNPMDLIFLVDRKHGDRESARHSADEALSLRIAHQCAVCKRLLLAEMIMVCVNMPPHLLIGPALQFCPASEAKIFQKRSAGTEIAHLTVLPEQPQIRVAENGLQKRLFRRRTGQSRCAVRQNADGRDEFGEELRLILPSLPDIAPDAHQIIAALCLLQQEHMENHPVIVAVGSLHAEYIIERGAVQPLRLLPQVIRIGDPQKPLLVPLMDHPGRVFSLHVPDIGKDLPRVRLRIGGLEDGHPVLLRLKIEDTVAQTGHLPQDMIIACRHTGTVLRDVIQVHDRQPVVLLSGESARLHPEILPAVHISHVFIPAAGIDLGKEGEPLSVHRMPVRLYIPARLLKAVRPGQPQCAQKSVIGKQQVHGLPANMDKPHRHRACHPDQIRGVIHLVLALVLQHKTVLFLLCLRLSAAHRPAVVIALYLAAADFIQKRYLLRRLHTLRDGMNAQRLGHVRDAGQNFAALLVEIPEEIHVELDLIKFKIMQGVERRILTAEIIQPDLVSGALKPLHTFPDSAAVARQRRLRDLEPQAFPRQVIRRRLLLGQAADVCLHKIIEGQIDGNRNRLLSLLHPQVHHPADLMQHIGVQPADKSRSLQNRDEDTRHNHSLLRILPAGKCLQAAESSGQGAHNRLKIDLDILLFQRLLIVLQDIGIPFDHLPHIRRIDRPAPARVVADGVAGNFGAVYRLPHLLIAGIGTRIADSGLQDNPLIADVAVYPAADCLNPGTDIFLVHCRTETIRADVREQLARERPAQCVSSDPDTFIPRLHAEHPVIFLEIDNIEADLYPASKAPLPAVLHSLLQHFLIEIMHSHEPGETLLIPSPLHQHRRNQIHDPDLSRGGQTASPQKGLCSPLLSFQRPEPVCKIAVSLRLPAQPVPFFRRHAAFLRFALI